MEDGPGAENLSQLQFGMRLVELQAQGDHAVPLPILTGWFMRFLVFCYYVSVTNLGYMWVYLDPFCPKSVVFGDRV